MDKDTLKYTGQWPMLIYILTILIMFSKHLLFLMISLKCFYKILSGLKAYKLLHLLIDVINSFLEKEFHIKYSLKESSFNKNTFTHWLCAKLNIWCKAVHQFLILMYGCLLYWIASMVKSLHFLIQFIRFYMLWQPPSYDNL